MHQSMKTRRFVVLVFSLFALTSSAFCFAGDGGQAPRILVTGEGSVELAPDMAILTLSVVREADTATAALEANSSAMNEVLAAMETEGIAARDLQTSGFSVQPRYVYPPRTSTGEPEPPRIVGYTVRNSLSVRIRDITRVGIILDKSISLGVNEGGNLVFGNDDPSAALAQARVMAVKDALAKAATLAEAAGVRAGGILEISEQSFNPRPQPMARAEMAMMRSADSVPVATGENSYKVTVNVTFAIEQ
jgi:uncharacterized protein YggE